tara:strand:- start:1352 stop:2566 length:1215 start_codon:yes stop_codon:yes gene_type:complete
MYFKKNKLFIEKVDALKIVRKYGTPTYCYSLNRLRNNIRNFQQSFKSISPLICFSVKSNNNRQILKEIKKFGVGADVVSKGEMMQALKAGILPKKIVFSGVGKKTEELKFAIEKKILLINTESESEIFEIERLAKLKKKIVNIGIRLNPNIDAKTLKKISTGKHEDKFGLTEKAFLNILNKFENSKYVKVKCLSVHIGSQITDYKPYLKMLNVLDLIIKKSKYIFEYVDLGGGMGIQYDKKTKVFNYKKYNKIIKKFLKRHNVKIIFEPGRSLIANTAVLFTQIIYIKNTNKKKFIILDAAMNDLMRPALYGSYHSIIPLLKTNKKNKRIHDFVGPVCETTDKFLSVKSFQDLKEKEFVAISDVGAYGMSLSSNYNLRPKPLEIMINNKLMKVVLKRQKLINII